LLARSCPMIAVTPGAAFEATSGVCDRLVT
jgi:hypothetical protein